MRASTYVYMYTTNISFQKNGDGFSGMGMLYLYGMGVEKVGKIIISQACVGIN